MNEERIYTADQLENIKLDLLPNGIQFRLSLRAERGSKPNDYRFLLRPDKVPTVVEALEKALLDWKKSYEI